MRAVVVSIGFPLLDPAYSPDPGERESYLTFYRWLAGEVRARGLKLVVESTVLMPNPQRSAFLASLTFEQYQRGRLETLVTLGRELRPDTVNGGREPRKFDWSSRHPRRRRVGSGHVSTRRRGHALARAGA